jgi:hypothetical protein
LGRWVRNARRSVTDAEVVTLCVAQEVLAIAHDRKLRRLLADTIQWLIGLHLSGIRQHIESIFWTLEARLDQRTRAFAA